MSKTILELKSELQAMLHSTSLDQVSNQTGLFNRAARELLHEVDLFETKKVANTAPIVGDVYAYAPPSDLKLNRVVDIRNLSVPTSDQTSHVTSRRFGRDATAQTFTVEYINGAKAIRYNSALGGATLINGGNAILNWAATGDVSNFALDSQTYLSSSGSLYFDLTGASTTATLTYSAPTTTNLSSTEDNSSFFVWLYIPNNTVMTSVSFSWGGDAANFWTATTATAADRISGFHIGWNLLRFDWRSATDTNTPVATALDHYALTITYTGTATNGFLLDSINHNNGKSYEMVYYSNQIFRDATTSLMKEEMSSDDDVVLLESQGLNLYLYKLAELASHQSQEQNSGQDVMYFNQKYEKAKQKYLAMFPSDAMRASTTYYRMPRHRKFLKINEGL